MNSVLDAVLSLQRCDQRIASLQKEIAALPAQLAKIDQTLDLHQRRLERDKSALAANLSERRKLDGEIQTQNQKISKLKGQTLEVKTNEQYRALQHEIEFCEAAIRKAEDRTLELMGESEPLEVNVKAAEAALKEERHQKEIEKNTARDRTAEDQKFLGVVQTERQQVAATIEPRTLTTYERIRKKTPIAVAEATSAGRCGLCQMALRPQFLQELRKGDQVMTCETCGRILVYNPPVAV